VHEYTVQLLHLSYKQAVQIYVHKFETTETQHKDTEVVTRNYLKFQHT
jgi:hypothetical protein